MMKTPSSIKNRRRARRGQNLVELALTLPFVVLFMFFTVELGRAWFVYEGAKMAATAGAHAAAIYHNPAEGQRELDSKLAAAGLEPQGQNRVTQVPNQHAYQADVSVVFRPFFGGLTIPTVSGPMQIIPNQFTITYQAVQDVAVY